tara:strand:- start:33896 stop:35299 length:1404 start_codon:yes stop_codon:yes gene_type:complete
MTIESFRLPARKASTRANDGTSRGRTVVWFENVIRARVEELKKPPPDLLNRLASVSAKLEEIDASHAMSRDSGRLRLRVDETEECKRAQSIDDNDESSSEDEEMLDAVDDETVRSHENYVIDDDPDLKLPRHLIRLAMDLRKEQTRLREEVYRIESGEAAGEYERTAREYLRMFKQSADDSAASGAVQDSLVSISQDQSFRRYRKRSDLDRIIRMANRGEDNLEPQRHSISDELLVEFHGADPPVYLMHGDLCPECSEPMRKNADGGELQCAKCGTLSAIQDSTSTTVGYTDDVEYANFTYKRDNHFQEWLNTTMAKQSCEIPEDVLNEVMSVLHRDRVKPEQVNAKRVREALKEHKLRKYYEHAMLIACKITGRDPPRMEPEIEERLRCRFRQMQQPFERFRDKLLPERKNFLSYSYVLYKLCELEDLPQFKQCFSLLKGRDKLYKQDQLWKSICEALDWAYIPSI